MSSGFERTLRNLCVLRVSAVNGSGVMHQRRVAEDAEVTQRRTNERNYA
jgi:hypothetical protein